MAERKITVRNGCKEVLGISFDTPQTAVELSQIAQKSVGFIEADVGSGSSFLYKQIIDENAGTSRLFFFTNLHVIKMVLDYYGLFHNAHRQGADLDKIPVGFNMKLNGSKIPLDKILVPKDFIFNNHPSHLDFAIFEIAQQRIEPLEFFEIPETFDIKQGAKVFAFGYPLGLEMSTHDGIISHIYDDAQEKSAVADIGRKIKWDIQHNILINHGSSGGPTVSDTGNLIGISTRGLDVGINFSLNLKHILQWASDPSNLEIISLDGIIKQMKSKAYEDSRFGG